MSIDLKKLLKLAKSAALEAGAEILKIYDSGDFSIEAKSDDSPLTKADKVAHQAIVSHLKNTEIPILSEEGSQIPFKERAKWKYFWMVDPLDGTKEFIKRNGEFTVNIALIHNSTPVLGVVFPPVLNELFWAIESQGAYKEMGGVVSKLETSRRNLSAQGIKVVASRSHLSAETEAFISSLDQPEIVSKGSSLKFLAVAEGSADIYPRFGPTMEWDTAAAQVIVSEAGGTVTLKDQLTPLSYNKEDLLNPYFIVLPFQKTLP